jgi:hypothetical protein
MVTIMPKEPMQGNVGLALIGSMARASAFNHNIIADRLNITPVLQPEVQKMVTANRQTPGFRQRPDMEKFIRDRAIMAYHNNDFTPEQQEGDYTQGHYNMANEMIQLLRYGDRNSAYDNIDQDGINNRVFNLTDPFVTGRPNVGVINENEAVRQQINLSEADARNRMHIERLVPSVPFYEFQRHGYADLRKDNPMEWRAYEQDGMKRFKDRLVKRDGSAQDTYDVGAPAPMGFTSDSYRTDHLTGDRIQANAGRQIVDSGRGAVRRHGNPERRTAHQQSFEDSIAVQQTMARLSEFPTNPSTAREYTFDVKTDQLANIPVRNMAFLKAVMNDTDFSDSSGDPQMELNVKMANLIDRYYRERPDLETDQDFSDAMTLFTKQASVNPHFERLDPMMTMELLDANTNRITRAINAKKTGRSTDYQAHVNMEDQMMIAAGKQAKPKRHVRAKHLKASQYDDDPKEFENIRAIMYGGNRHLTSSHAPIRADQDQYMNTNRIGLTNENHAPMALDRDISIDNSALESMNGGTTTTRSADVSLRRTGTFIAA